MAKRLLTKEHTLLLYSEAIKAYPDILKLLEAEKDITDDYVNGLPNNERNFFDNILPLVLKQAIDEWKGDPKRIDDTGEDKSGWVHCKLDNRLNRYIFYIENQLNGTALNVGSECIKHFWDHWNDHFGGKNVDQLKLEATRNKLLSDLNEHIPGIWRTIENWDFIVKDYEIVLPNSIEQPFLELGNRAGRLLNTYLEGKQKDHDYVGQFREILSQRENLINDINNYVMENMSGKNIPKKLIQTWLENNGGIQTLKKLKEDGKITWGTAHRIEEPSYMKSIVPDLNIGLKDIGFQIISSDEKRRGYVLQPVFNKQILLFVRHNKLLFYCGWLLFNENAIEPFNFENTFKLCSLNGDTDVYKVLEGLNTPTSKFKFQEIDLEYEEVVIFDKEDGNYILANPKKIAEDFKGLVFGLKDKTSADLVKFIKCLPGKRYSRAEIKEHRRMREEYNKRKY